MSTTSRSVVSILMVLAGGVGASCGGGSSEGKMCDTFSPCGGAVEGRWTIDHLCLQDADIKETFTGVCQVLTVDTTQVTARGHFYMNSDKTYESTIALGGKVSVVFPPVCAKSNGVQVKCPQWGASIKGGLGQASAFSDASCTGDSNCRCDFTYKTNDTAETGTFQSAGNTLTTHPVTGTPDSSPYCVDGNSLSLQLISGGSALKSYLVLKQ